jgi:tRNA pseudouridine38-40 synthase
VNSAESNEPRTRVRLDIAYDGSELHGWAKQPGLRTVQGELEAALATIFSKHPPAPTLAVAGRTDVGVHAIGQVAHLELTARQMTRLATARRGVRSTSDDVVAVGTLARRLNGTAGAHGDIRVDRATIAPLGFDARFSALWRRYEYRIADAQARWDPRLRRSTLWLTAELNVDAMNEAATTLLGLHDFASFCRPRPGATTIRTLQDFAWRRDADGVLIAELRADAFCHSMVRALVGACVAVGESRIDAHRVVELRDDARRTSEFKVLPAHGLTLIEVGYPADAELAVRAEQTRARRDAST